MNRSVYSYLIGTIFSFGLCILLSSSVHAQSQWSPAYVDMQAVENGCDALNVASIKISKDRDDFQNYITNEEKRIQEAVKDLQTKQSILSASVVADKKKVLEREIATLQSDIQKKQESLEAARVYIGNILGKYVKDISTNIAKEKKYDIVLYSHVALYLTPNAENITSSVIKELNRVLQKIDLSDYLTEKKQVRSKK